MGGNGLKVTRVVFAAVLIMMASAAFANETSEYLQAIESNTPEALQAFLRKYPTGKLASQVRSALKEFERKDFDEAKEQNTLEACDEFLVKWPNSTLTSQAQKLCDELLLKMAKKKDGAQAFQEAWLKARSPIAKSRIQIQINRLRREEELEQLLASGSVDELLALSHQRRTPIGRLLSPQEIAKVNNRLEDVLFRQIKEEPTIDLCEKYLARFRDTDEKKREVERHLQKLLYEKIKEQPTIAVCKEYLKRFESGRYTTEVKKLLEPLLFEQVTDANSVYAYETYLDFFSESFRSKDIKARLEPLLYEQVKKEATLEAYEKFLETFSRGKEAEEIRGLLEPLLYQAAAEVDRVPEYEGYLKKFPSGVHAKEARERIKWWKSQKAVIEVDFPKVVEESASPYGNVSRPFWQWEIVFRETGGVVGFKVKGKGAIYDLRGGKWTTTGESHISRAEDIVVEPGSTAKSSYWCSSTDHTFCNGRAVFIWEGEDDLGRRVRFEERVLLKHTDCPGPGKKKGD